MKFTHLLLTKMVPEWIKLYINYKLLKNYLSISTSVKKLLMLAKRTRNQKDYQIIKKTILDNNDLMSKLNQDNDSFISYFQQEVSKVETFIIWKWSDLKGKMRILQEQIHLMKLQWDDLEIQRENQEIQQQEKKNQKDQIQVKSLVSPQEQTLIVNPLYDSLVQDQKINFPAKYKQFHHNKHILIETLYSFYNECLYFQQYISLNQDGIRKILKKYKKHMIKGIRKKNNEKHYFGETLNKMSLAHMPTKIKSLLFDTEQIMIQSFYPGRAKMCRENLRKFGAKELQLSTLFYFGFFAGFALVFIFIIVFMRLEGYLDVSNYRKAFYSIFPIFRGPALLLVFYWCLALDIWGWNVFRVNYKIYLGFNHHFSTLTEIFKRTCVLSSIYLFVLVVYILQKEGFGQLINDAEFMDPMYLPIILWVIGLTYIFVPTSHYLNGQGRMWMYRMFRGAIYHHFVKYESRYTFFTDQIVSLIIPIGDLSYTVCYYIKDGDSQENKEHILDECRKNYCITTLVAGLFPYILLSLQAISRAKDRNNGKFFCTLEMVRFLKSLLVILMIILSFLSIYDDENQDADDFFYYWMAVAALSVIISYWWDVTQEWTLLQRGARYRYLRDDLGYNNPKIYYFLAILNFFLRCIWTISIAPAILHIFSFNGELVLFYVGLLEILRSKKFLIFSTFQGTIANFLKIEKEHIQNEYQFKTVMDYKFPFNHSQIENRNKVNEEDDKHTHWSVSSLSNSDLLKQLPQSPEKHPLDRNTDTFKRVLSVMIQPQSDEIGSPLKKKQQEEVEQENSVDQFRLTYIVKKDYEKHLINKKDSLDISRQNVNMEILNQVRIQEKLQMVKIQEVHEANLHYKKIISNLKVQFDFKEN